MKPFVIITKIDLFEQQIRNDNIHLKEKEVQEIITEKKFNLIMELSKKLVINKENVDFIENYSHESNKRKLVIDYYAMTTLGRMLSECE